MSGSISYGHGGKIVKRRSVKATKVKLELALTDGCIGCPASGSNGASSGK